MSCGIHLLSARRIVTPPRRPRGQEISRYRGATLSIIANCCLASSTQVAIACGIPTVRTETVVVTVTFRVPVVYETTSASVGNAYRHAFAPSPITSPAMSVITGCSLDADQSQMPEHVVLA